jgi:hypothetical protein
MQNKMALRWKFVLDGMASVRPEMNDEGEVEFMLVETQYSATRCYSPQEVDDAIDIAMHLAQRDQTIYVH